MAEVTSLTLAELYGLASSAVARVDRFGPRGTTLCTMRETEAMAVLLVVSGALPWLQSVCASLEPQATLSPDQSETGAGDDVS